MVEILGPSVHRESYPPEIDVYRVPHNRMKQLVSSMMTTLPEIQECLTYEQSLIDKPLQSVYATVWELKTHEIIENTIIMNKLKERLRSRQVYNQSVCNCHEDSDLIKIINLVELVYSSPEIRDRLFFWQRLEEAIYEFFDNFLPHMEEEENTFQPLLNEYFDYEELKELKETVLFQHKEWKLKVEKEKSLKHVNRVQNSSDYVVERKDTYCQVAEQKTLNSISANNLPDELVHKIFSFLSNPKDLSRASMVCVRWNDISKSSLFWRNLPLSQWERGIWTFENVDLYDILLAENHSYKELQENSLYEKIPEFTASVGYACKTLSISGSQSITNTQLKKILKNVPNIIELDCSYTSVCHIAFADRSLSLEKIEKLDLSGCRNVSDLMMELIMRILTKGSGKLRWLSLSGCELLTDKSLAYLQKVTNYLEWVDFSGCYRMSGASLNKFTEMCPNLKGDCITYCTLIEEGPNPSAANGCNNIDSDIRSCCIKYQN